MHRADAPAAEEIGIEQSFHHPARALGCSNAGEEQLPRVRRAHEAGALLAVERQRIGAAFLVPESLLELAPRRLGFEGQPRR